MRSVSPIKAKLYPYLLQFNETSLPLSQSPVLRSTPDPQNQETLLLPLKPRNIKVWDLPKILEKESHRPKVAPTVHRTGQTSRFNHSITDFIQLLKSDRSKVPIRKVTLVREKAKPKLRPFKTGSQDQSNQPLLYISNRNTEGLSTLRPRFNSKTAIKKSGGLQPLQLISYKGLSDPCIRVLNYPGLESQSGVTVERRSWRALKRESPEVRIDTKTALVESKAETGVDTPPEPPKHYKQRKAAKLTTRLNWQSTGLEGWNTSPPDFSPLSRI